MNEADPPRRGRTLEQWFTSAATIAGAIAALAGFVYLVGGMVMWLRFRTADLPADQGVALMSREQLFVVGLRLMIIPTLVTGALAWFLADRATHDHGRVAIGRAGVAVLVLLAALAPIWGFAVALWPIGLAMLLDVLVVVGASALVVSVRGHRDRTGRLAALPRWLAPAIATTAVVLVLVLCLAVATLEVDDRLWARLAVAGAALVVIAVPTLLLLAARLPRPRPLHAWLAAGVLAVVLAMIVASGWWVRLAIVLGALVIAGVLVAVALLHPGARVHFTVPRRWLVPLLATVAVGLIVPWSFASATWPLGLGLLIAVWLWRRRRPRLTVYMAATAILAAAIVSIGRQLDEPVQLLRATVTFKEPGPDVNGAYVNASGDLVYVGDQRTGTIQAIPRAEVRMVTVGPPEDRAPSPSLLSHILPGERRFSARPLEVWCDGERYGWFEAGKLCRTQPDLLWTTRVHDRFFNRLGMPVRIRCPKAADDVCRGWVHFRSREGYKHGRAGIPRPVVPDPVPFAVGPSNITEVCATLTAGQLRLLQRESGEKAVLFDVMLADDAAGATVLRRDRYGLLVGPRFTADVALSESRCVPRLTMTHGVGQDGPTVRVVARPGGRGITPWHVEGAIRLSAVRAGDAEVRRLGTLPLRRGRTAFAPKLPPGQWVLTARYTSVAGRSYSEPSQDAAVTIPAPAQGAKARSAG